MAALIDVRQAETLVAGAAQTIPDTERQIEQTENVISILLGRPPAPVPRGRPLGEQIGAQGVPAGVPSSLLERRPDVRQAEAQLAAATARIGVAKSDYFPRVFLTRRGRGRRHHHQRPDIRASGPVRDRPLVHAADLQLGARRGGRRRRPGAAPRRPCSSTSRWCSEPSATSRTRWSSTPSAASPGCSRKLFTIAARDAARLANIRYTGGVTTYLEVLDSDRQLFDAELGLVRNQRDELLAVVRLYKALGGGWQE